MTGSETRAFRLNFRPLVLAGALFIAALAAIPSAGPALEALASSTLEIETAKGRHSFTVEIAANDAQRARGLMFRRALAPGHGMLFVYSRPRMISMWMKNTFIPLDMIFIGASGKVVSVHERAVPHSLVPISSEKRALAVLELAGGSVARFGIRPGDRVLNSHFGATE
jgi:uncharacterized membrane protein (UPF0127 family)